MATLSYVVAWPKARVTVDNKRVILERGQALPKQVSDAQAELMLSFGAVAVVDPTAAGSGEDTAVPDDFEVDNPGKYKVKEVQAFLATASEDDRDRVINAEADRDKPRTGIVQWEPEGSGDDDGDA